MTPKDTNETEDNQSPLEDAIDSPEVENGNDPLLGMPEQRGLLPEEISSEDKGSKKKDPKPEPGGKTTGMLNRSAKADCPLCQVWGIPWDDSDPTTWGKQHIYAEKIWKEWNPQDRQHRWVGDVIETVAEFGPPIKVDEKTVKDHFGKTHRIEQPMLSSVIDHESYLYETQELSDLNKKIIEALFRQKVLTTQQITEIFFHNTKTQKSASNSALIALNILASDWYAYRYSPSKEDSERRGAIPHLSRTLIWFLGKASIPYIQETYEIEQKFYPHYLNRARDVDSNNLMHDIKANDVFVSLARRLYKEVEIESDGKKKEFERVFPEGEHWPEGRKGITTKTAGDVEINFLSDNWYGPGISLLPLGFVDVEGKERRILPDGFASLSVGYSSKGMPSSQMPFFIEYDHASKTITETAEQLYSYHSLGISGAAKKRFPQLDVDNYAIPVLMVFSGATRMKSVLKAFQEKVDDLGLDSGVPIFVAAEEKWKENPLADKVVISAWDKNMEAQAFIDSLIVSSQDLIRSGAISADTVLQIDPRKSTAKVVSRKKEKDKEGKEKLFSLDQTKRDAEKTKKREKSFEAIDWGSPEQDQSEQAPDEPIEDKSIKDEQDTIEDDITEPVEVIEEPIPEEAEEEAVEENQEEFIEEVEEEPTPEKIHSPQEETDLFAELPDEHIEEPPLEESIQSEERPEADLDEDPEDSSWDTEDTPVGQEQVSFPPQNNTLNSNPLIESISNDFDELDIQEPLEESIYLVSKAIENISDNPETKSEDFNDFSNFAGEMLTEFRERYDLETEPEVELLVNQAAQEEPVIEDDPEPAVPELIQPEPEVVPEIDLDSEDPNDPFSDSYSEETSIHQEEPPRQPQQPVAPAVPVYEVPDVPTPDLDPVAPIPEAPIPVSEVPEAPAPVETPIQPEPNVPKGLPAANQNPDVPLYEEHNVFLDNDGNDSFFEDISSPPANPEPALAPFNPADPLAPNNLVGTPGAPVYDESIPEVSIGEDEPDTSYLPPDSPFRTDKSAQIKPVEPIVAPGVQNPPPSNKEALPAASSPDDSPENIFETDPDIFSQTEDLFKNIDTKPADQAPAAQAPPVQAPPVQPPPVQPPPVQPPPVQPPPVQPPPVQPPPAQQGYSDSDDSIGGVNEDIEAKMNIEASKRRARRRKKK